MSNTTQTGTTLPSAFFQLLILQEVNSYRRSDPIQAAAFTKPNIHLGDENRPQRNTPGHKDWQQPGLVRVDHSRSIVVVSKFLWPVFDVFEIKLNKNQLKGK